MNNPVHWTRRGQAYTPEGQIRAELFTDVRVSFLRQLSRAPLHRPGRGRDVVRFALRLRLAAWDDTERYLHITDGGRQALAVYGKDTPDAQGHSASTRQNGTDAETEESLVDDEHPTGAAARIS